jgi:hypothetical protein
MKFTSPRVLLTAALALLLLLSGCASHPGRRSPTLAERWQKMTRDQDRAARDFQVF